MQYFIQKEKKSSGWWNSLQLERACLCMCVCMFTYMSVYNSLSAFFLCVCVSVCVNVKYICLTTPPD